MRICEEFLDLTPLELVENAEDRVLYSSPVKGGRGEFARGEVAIELSRTIGG